jgi:hypothetical protein
MLEIPRYSRIVGEISGGTTTYVAKSRFSRHKWSPDDQLPRVRDGRAILSRDFCRETHFWRHNPASYELRRGVRQDRLAAIEVAPERFDATFCRRGAGGDDRRQYMATSTFQCSAARRGQLVLASPRGTTETADGRRSELHICVDPCESAVSGSSMAGVVGFVRTAVRSRLVFEHTYILRIELLEFA